MSDYYTYASETVQISRRELDSLRGQIAEQLNEIYTLNEQLKYARRLIAQIAAQNGGELRVAPAWIHDMRGALTITEDLMTMNTIIRIVKETQE